MYSRGSTSDPSAPSNPVVDHPDKPLRFIPVVAFAAVVVVGAAITDVLNAAASSNICNLPTPNGAAEAILLLLLLLLIKLPAARQPDVLFLVSVPAPPQTEPKLSRLK